MAIKKDQYIKFAEPIFLISIWLLVLLLPILILNEDGYIDWERVTESWMSISPFLGLFLLNHFVLVPYLLFRNYQKQYILIAFLIIALFTVASYSLKPDRPGPPGLDNPEEMRGPPMERPMGNKPRLGNPGRQRMPFAFPPYVGVMITTFLLIGFDTGLRVFVQWLQLGKANAMLEKENITSELAFLRHQISPHFFMNTLNNIHALMDFDVEKAKDSVIQLSKLMRQLLYENESDKVPLKKEIEFIQNYIALMALRFTENVKINQKYPEVIPDKSIPPMLLTSLIENAFKHGVSYSADSYISLNIACDEQELLCTIENSKSGTKPNEDYSGIGIENTRKRLTLLYKDSYTFNVNETESTYQVKLVVPI